MRRGLKANNFAFNPISLKEKIFYIERSEIENRWTRNFAKQNICDRILSFSFICAVFDISYNTFI